MGTDSPTSKFSLDAAHTKAERFFSDLWSHGDPWDLATSPLDRMRYEKMLSLVDARRYERALEIGCAGGHFTVSLLDVAREIVAIDVAPEALARARDAVGEHLARVDFRAVNALTFDYRAEKTFDLIVLAETIYYLGWLYPAFDVGWMAAEIFQATSPGGDLLLVNTRSDEPILSPWLIATYEDLFTNVGFATVRQDTVVGEKQGVTFDISLRLYRKPIM